MDAARDPRLLPWYRHHVPRRDRTRVCVRTRHAREGVRMKQKQGVLCSCLACVCFAARLRVSRLDKRACNIPRLVMETRRCVASAGNQSQSKGGAKIAVAFIEKSSHAYLNALHGFLQLRDAIARDRGNGALRSPANTIARHRRPLKKSRENFSLFS